MREAGQRVHPHLSCCTVASVIRTFWLENRYVFTSLPSTLLRALCYSISHYHITCTGYCRVLMLLLQPRWWFLWNIPWLLILRCFSTVDDTVYTVKYCKKKKQTDDNLWLYFSRMTGRPSGGGRQRLFTQQQELAIVRADNAIRFHQLQQKILADRQVFNNINHVSIITIRRILGKHNITMKQLYRVPFERNSVRVKGLRREYVQVSVTVLYIYNTVLVKSSSSWMCTISVPHGSIRRATQVPVWWGGGSVCVAL